MSVPDSWHIHRERESFGFRICLELYSLLLVHRRFIVQVTFSPHVTLPLWGFRMASKEQRRQAREVQPRFGAGWFEGNIYIEEEHLVFSDIFGVIDFREFPVPSGKLT